jgi:hypothetical protein
MAEEKDQRILKILLAIILVAAIAIAFWAYNNHNENEAIKEELRTEKEAIQRELDNISKAYSQEIERGIALDAEVEQARDRIERLVDSVDNLRADVKLLSKLRKELGAIKEERERLLDRIRDLEVANSDLKKENQKTQQQLEEERRARNVQDSTITEIKSDLTEAAKLIPVNLESTGVIIRSSGRQKENDRARRLDDIKVCFTVPANSIAENGLKSYYLQVINPENNVLGTRKLIKFEDQELRYSKKIEFNYQGKELDICELVGANEDNITSGIYRVNLFLENRLVNTFTMELR